MSIPPFVCNTPPPPEQCEDDRDVDDYDEIQYHLSQDEDDSNDLGFGVTTFNYSDTTRIPSKNHKADQAAINTRIESENHFKSKPENNLEYFSINIENIPITISNSEQHIIDNESNDTASTSEQSDITINNNNTYNDTSKLNGIEEKNIVNDSFIEEDTSKVKEDSVNVLHNLCNDTVCEVIDDVQAFQNKQIESDTVLELERPDTKVLNDKSEVLDDDDFGDFEDFKIDEHNEHPTTIDEFNPWQTEACAETQFHASFDSSGFAETRVVEAILPEEDDDFGDFDDFRSNTNIEESTSSKDCDSVISSSHTSINEAVINKVIYSLFEEELLEPENSNIKKLESSLSETWRYLQQVEERQPYMVNWNNSVTQKALLKALCIDSRNILFAPKWGSNMPRYAANLCATPLQPLKQSTSIENSVSNPPSGSTNSWVNPSTQDGHETTYAEAILLDLENLMATLDQMAHNQSALKISDLISQACNPEESVPSVHVAPTSLTAADLDILDVPHSINKTYSGANVLPIRQISLPDTHIFTPSDSETPRSKTIHYDYGPPIVMPESENNIPAVDDDFSDFQDFKRSPEYKTSSLVGITSSVNSVAATKQVLEPIKMDVVTPAINWPEPGQIKETFDVFSDYIANNAEDSVETNTSVTQITAVQVSAFSSVVPNHVPSVSDDQFDDDFNNFQSAIPSKASVENNVNSTKSVVEDPAISTPIRSKVKPITKDDFFPISNPTVTNFQMEQTNFNSLPSKINHTSQPVSEILQPLSINTHYTHKSNSGQILQPLSLESYSQINWPDPGNLQDLSRFNPIETVPTLKNDCGSASGSKHASPARVPKSLVVDDDGWGEFVSIKPKQHAKPLSSQHQQPTCDEDEWSDFVSSSTTKPPNGVNTISFNVHTNQNIQKTSAPHNKSSNQISIDVPSLNYITPKSNNHKVYSSKHLNL